MKSEQVTGNNVNPSRPTVKYFLISLRKYS